MDKRFLSIDDLASLKPPSWLVDGLIDTNSLTMIAGPPGSYKSFFLLDIMLCLAAGRPWNGRNAVPSKVLYVLGEGKSTLLKRAQAWLFYNKVSNEEVARLKTNFKVSFNVPQFAHKAQVDTMLRDLQDEGFEPNVIVVDTFARSFVGMDENSQKDAGMWVESADRLRQLGYTVIFAHHTAKNVEFGVKYRGSSAILGAMDTALTMVREGGPASDRVVVSVVKQKDHDEGKPLLFRRVQVTPPGSKSSSIVLIPAANFAANEENEEVQIDRAIDALMSTPYESNAARGRELARQFGMSEAAGIMRVSRWKKGA